MDRLPRATYFGVFFLALSIVVLQIALTRVFSIMMWHHLTYMVVSIALLGFGASGSILTAQRVVLRTGSPMKAVALYTTLYGLAVLGALALLTQVQVDCFQLWEDKSNLLALLAVYGITAVPFLFGGMALGMVLTVFVRHVNRLYFIDLLGSGLGGALSVVSLQWFSGTGNVVLAAAIGLLAAFLFGFGVSRGIRTVTGIAAGFGLLACLLFTSLGSGLGLPQWEWHPPFAVGKDFRGYSHDPDLDRIPSATAQVEVAPNRKTVPGLGGDIGYSAIHEIDSRLVGQDGTAPTVLMKGAGQLENFSYLTQVQPASGYVAHRAAGGGDPDVLVIGVGGGVDVMVALLSGAKHVTAVEINTGMIEAVTERYDDYLDGLFRPGAHSYSDRIDLVNSEGRSYMRSQSGRFDVIQMSGVDSFTALSTGAYTLSESYLYTTDAVKEFYAHLNEGGIVNYSRFLLTSPRKPRETLRLANIAYTALRELGVEDASSQIAILQGRAWASTMIKRGAFTAVEIDALKQFCRDEGFLGLIFDPLRPRDEPAKPAISVVDVSGILAAGLGKIVGDLLPGTPDEQRGFVERSLLDAYRVRIAEDLPAAQQRLAELAPEYPEGARARLSTAASTGLLMLESASTPPTAQFAETAVPFHSLLQSPAAEREAFIDAYPYDISACTDDSPFFFNYYRYSRVLEAVMGGGGGTGLFAYHPDFPIGHVVLIASMLQILLLAVAMIFFPLIKLSREGLRAEGTWRYFSYFASLGVGFMFVEIVLMQKMVILLGHPTYALSVVLASLLVSAGIGSLLAGRIRSLSRRTLLTLAAVIVVLVCFVAWSANTWMNGLLGFSLPVRMAAVAAVIFPIGLALGAPFPTGMRIVERNCPQLLPWCWAINGFLSVFSAVFCIVLSMFLGFTTVFLIAGAIYAVGFAAMPAAKPVAASGG